MSIFCCMSARIDALVLRLSGAPRPVSAAQKPGKKAGRGRAMDVPIVKEWPRTLRVAFCHVSLGFYEPVALGFWRLVAAVAGIRLRYALSCSALANSSDTHRTWPTASHRTSGAHAAPGYWRRLDENEKFLADAYELISDAVDARQARYSSRRVVLDNYYLIRGASPAVRRPTCSKIQPRTASSISGAAAGTPRVYDLALNLISHSHGRVTPDGLHAFVAFVPVR